MSSFFIYLLKLSICLAAFYLFYALVLRKLTFYKGNRYYLVGYSLIAFFIPFINIYSLASEETKVIENIPVLRGLSMQPLTSSLHSEETESMLWQIAFILLLTGIGILFVRLLLQYLSLRKVRRTAPFILQDNIKLYSVNGNINPFSFGNSIFINNKLHDETELEKILLHEFVHVKQKHTVDLIIAELLCVLNWYNPFAWLIRKAIRENLEYLADQQVLMTGVDARQYQYLLLKVMGGRQFTITNHLNFSSLKNRIVMMNKLKSARIHLVKFTFLLPVCAMLLFAFREKISLLNEIGTATPIEKITGMVADEKYLSNDIRQNTSDGQVIAERGKTNGGDTVPPAPPPQPLPPAKAAPPAPPAPLDSNIVSPPLPVTPLLVEKLPASIQSMHVENNKVTIVYKNGKRESFDLNDPKQKASFYRNHGIAPVVPKEPSKPKAESSELMEVPVKPSVQYDEVIEIQDDKVINVQGEKLIKVQNDKVIKVQGEKLNKVQDDKIIKLQNDEVITVQTDEVIADDVIEVPVTYQQTKVMPVKKVRAKPASETKAAKPARETKVAKPARSEIQKVKPAEKSIEPVKQKTPLWPEGSAWLPKKDNC